MRIIAALTVATLTAAFAARLLMAPLRPGRSSLSGRWPRSVGSLIQAGQIAAIGGVLLMTALAAVGAAADSDLLSARELRRFRAAAVRLTISPPIDGFQSASETQAVTQPDTAWTR